MTIYDNPLIKKLYKLKLKTLDLKMRNYKQVKTKN